VGPAKAGTELAPSATQISKADRNEGNMKVRNGAVNDEQGPRFI
jgi:hypothetical protein